MLGRTDRESPIYAADAARAGGWSGLTTFDDADAPAELSELLDLGRLKEALATVASIADLAAVVHLGHPEQPNPLLEEALLAADARLGISAVQAVAPRWVIAGRPGTGAQESATGGGQVIVDEAGMRDCGEVLRSLGLLPRLVPGRRSIPDRVTLAGPEGLLVVEPERLPEGYVALPLSESLNNLPPVWYGLLDARATWPEFTEPAQVWLAFGPSVDHRGSLSAILALIAEAGIDLQHLRSHPSSEGPHVFFSSFRCDSSVSLAKLVAELDERQISNRVLAAIPGAEFTPGPHSFAPRWEHR